MLPIALQVGISAYGFWEMTYGEIVMTIEAFKENERLRIREIAGFNYQLANLIGLSVARIMDKDAEYPTIQKAFPNIFNELADREEPQEEDWQVTKAKMLQYAEAVNRERGDI